MIQIITGVPGGGKSYYAVHEILEHLSRGELVVHNIHGLSDPRAIQLDFGNVPLDADYLFNLIDRFRFERGLPADSVVHVYIDECQRYYPYELKDPKVVYFFDFHRHHGLNISLISQDIKKISPKISTLAEFEVRAVKPMFQFGGGFQYNLISSGEPFGKKRLKKKPEVFAAYTSFTSGTAQAKKSRLGVIVPIAVAASVAGYFILSYSLKHSFDKISPATVEADTVHAPRSSPVPDMSSLGGGPPVQNSTKYMGPKIKQYSPGRDSLLVESGGLDVWLPVHDYLDQFPPTVYGYGFLHLPHRKFYLLDAATSQYLFPVENTVYVRSYIKSDPVAPPQPQTFEPDLAHYSRSQKPDASGYTRFDYDLIRSRKLGMTAPDSPSQIASSPGQIAPAVNATLRP